MPTACGLTACAARVVLLSIRTNARSTFLVCKLGARCRVVGEGEGDSDAFALWKDRNDFIYGWCRFCAVFVDFGAIQCLYCKIGAWSALSAPVLSNARQWVRQYSGVTTVLQGAIHLGAVVAIAVGQAEQTTGSPYLQVVVIVPSLLTAVNLLYRTLEICSDCCRRCDCDRAGQDARRAGDPGGVALLPAAAPDYGAHR